MNSLIGEVLLRALLLGVAFSFFGAVFVRFGTRVVCQFTPSYWVAYRQFLLGYFLLGVIWMATGLFAGPDAGKSINQLVRLAMAPLAVLVHGAVYASGLRFPEGEEIGLRKGLLVALASTLCSIVVGVFVVMFVYLIVT